MIKELENVMNMKDFFYINKYSSKIIEIKFLNFTTGSKHSVLQNKTVCYYVIYGNKFVSHTLFIWCFLRYKTVSHLSKCLSAASSWEC